MDQTTEQGFTPEYVADQVLQGVLRKSSEMTISTFQPKAAIILRSLLPSLYFWLMRKRAKNNLKHD